MRLVVEITLAMSPFSCSSSSDCCVCAARVTVVTAGGCAPGVTGVALATTKGWGGWGEGDVAGTRPVAGSSGVLMNSIRPPSTQIFGVKGYGGVGGVVSAQDGGADLRLFS